ncbi:GtrA family protein [Antrihabitans sp. NCIMB 15449]|uniref:GtrA family protein n=1 Tax=Antrihabitans spumae TaxID=3373370 RepID=A0ABW7JHN3_9NOCA
MRRTPPHPSKKGGSKMLVAEPALRQLRAFDLHGNQAFAQLVRFAMVGVVSNVVYFVLFVALRPEGVMTANLVGAAVSTALANELHRRVTFGAAHRVGWLAAQWESGGLAIVGLITSSVALGALEIAFPDASAMTAGAFVIAVGAAVGGVRFLLLRGWVFAA